MVAPLTGAPLLADRDYPEATVIVPFRLASFPRYSNTFFRSSRALPLPP